MCLLLRRSPTLGNYSGKVLDGEGEDGGGGGMNGDVPSVYGAIEGVRWSPTLGNYSGKVWKTAGGEGGRECGHVWGRRDNIVSR